MNMYTLKRASYLNVKLQHVRFIFLLNNRINHKKPSLFINTTKRLCSTDELNNQIMEQPKPLKHLLDNHFTSNDMLSNKLNACSSIQQVFNFIKENEMWLKPEHLSQSILVLWDIQNMFQHITSLSYYTKVESLMKDYSLQVRSRIEFKELLNLILTKIDEFDVESLSCMFMYFNKMGLPIAHPINVQLLLKLEEHFLNKKFLFSSLSRYLTTIFSYYRTNTGYFAAKNIIPIVYGLIEKCDSQRDIEQVTMSLKNLNNILPKNVLEEYKSKVNELIDKNVINSKEIYTIIKIVSFLNFPQWREENLEIICKCLLLLRNQINNLNVYELLIIYEMFCKINEPAELLNELQRHALKFLYEIEEEYPYLHNLRLRLLTCIISFSTTSQRKHYENIVRKYLDYSLNGNELLELYKIILILKLSDSKVNGKFWNKLLICFQDDNEFADASFFKIANGYINYNMQVNQRHLKIENYINQEFDRRICEGIISNVTEQFAMLSAFVIAFGTDISILNHVVNKLQADWEQLNSVHCLILSKSLQLGKKLRNSILKERYIDKLEEILDKCLNRFIKQDLNVSNSMLLLRSLLHRKKLDRSHVNNIFEAFNCNKWKSSSTIIKNLTHSLHIMNILNPNILDMLVAYICENKDSVLATNAERVAYLCYYLGYTPKHYKYFLKIFTDLLVRDQERVNGLLYLQSCLTLSFFNEISMHHIQQVFNSEFMEKLDYELANCYDEDVYPRRVRHKLMELNRAVCIDHPEAGIPWFHQKFNETSHAYDPKTFNFNKNLKYYLETTFNNLDNLRRNVSSHYGYRIDYLLEFNSNKSEKLALLLFPHQAYTKCCVQLKGEYQTKIRHLEILGYHVAVLSIDKFNSYIYGVDKVNYMKDVLKKYVVT